MRRRRFSLAAAAAASLSIGSAPLGAVPRDFCPRKGSAIDPSTPVDKEAFAESLLDAAGVPRRLEHQVHALRVDVPLDALTDREFLLLNGSDLCDRETLHCSKGDRAAVQAAAIYLRDALARSQPGLALSRPVASPNEFFLVPAATITCVPMADDAEEPAMPVARGTAPLDPTRPFAKRGPGPFSLANVRLRGSPSDLLFEHAGAGYEDASKATLSFEDDRTSNTTTTNLVAAVGYVLRIGEGAQAGGRHPYSWALRAIPYAAFNIDTSHVAGQAKTTKSNQLDTGATIAVLWSALSPDFSHQDGYLGIYPHYLINYKDHSAILGLNLLLRPYMTRGFNSVVPLGDTGLEGDFIGSLRFNNGHFTRTGTRDPVASHDFSRVGGELGLYVGSGKSFPIPFDVTVTGIYMQALAGRPNHLSQLKADLGIYFSSKKNFGLDFAYTRGRIEDLAEREHKFTFGLAFKY